jgi:hypothetical protein
MWVIVTVVAGVALAATYLTWTATRVDRLHARAAAAYTALDGQSMRRATAAAELGLRRGLVEVQTAAKGVLHADPEDRELAENDLTRALRVAEAHLPPEDLAAVDEASRRLALARQVHTDLVRDALAVRRHPVVRLFRFTRRHQLPRFFDIDQPTLEGSPNHA